MLQVILDPPVVDPDDVPQGLRAILLHGGSSHLGWLFHARTNLTRFGATNPANVRKIFYVIALWVLHGRLTILMASHEVNLVENSNLGHVTFAGGWIQDRSATPRSF